MVRLTAMAVGIAVTLGACKGSDQRAARPDSAMGDVSAGAASADSTAGAATNAAGAAMDTMGRKADTAAGTLGQQADTTVDRMGQRADTAAGEVGRTLDTAASKVKSGAAKAGAAVGATASSAELRVKLSTLSRDQVKQLQAALNDNGCDAGQPDGALGSKTVQAVKCGLQKNNISGNDLDALYKALNLNFKS